MINPIVLRDYIDKMESSLCGEYHGYEWPDCYEQDHDCGRELLAQLGYTDEL